MDTDYFDRSVKLKYAPNVLIFNVQFNYCFYYMYRRFLTLKPLHFTHKTRVCSAQFLQHTAPIFVYRITQLIFVMESHIVLCEVRTENLCSILKNYSCLWHQLRDKYSVIKKDGLNFVRIYFLNYTSYVNDLHNI